MAAVLQPKLLRFPTMEGVSCMVGQEGDCRGEKEPAAAPPRAAVFTRREVWGDIGPSPVHLEDGGALDLSPVVVVAVVVAAAL